MEITQHGRVTLYDYAPTPDDFAGEVLHGLTQPIKILPSKFFYDAQGSRLFEDICTLEEYYPTRTEIGILRGHAAAIADLIGPAARLVELGSGSSTKTHILLDHLAAPAAYVPIDISRTQLLEAAEAIAAAYPTLPVQAVCADYTQAFALPEPPTPAARTVAFFPGSTIGNLEPADAEGFLRSVVELCGPSSGLLIGVDLRKDRARLEAAYNDRRGVTAAFNLNLLARINSELGADFDLDGFRHQAVYDAEAGRIVMYLVSRRPQTVHLQGHAIAFAEGERITTEYSYKYEIAGLHALAARAGYAVVRVWTDPEALFSVHYLTAGS